MRGGSLKPQDKNRIGGSGLKLFCSLCFIIVYSSAYRQPDLNDSTVYQPYSGINEGARKWCA